MALIKSVTYFSTDFPTAYHKVIKNGDTGEIIVAILASKLSRENGDPPIKKVTFMVSDEDRETYFSEDVLKLVGNTAKSQSYVWLKTLPQFAEAVDA